MISSLLEGEIEGEGGADGICPYPSPATADGKGELNDVKAKFRVGLIWRLESTAQQAPTCSL